MPRPRLFGHLQGGSPTSAAQSTPQGSDWPSAPAPQAKSASCNAYPLLITLSFGRTQRGRYFQVTVLQYFRIMSPLFRTVSPGCPRCSSDATSPGIYLQMSFFPGIPLSVKSTSEYTFVELHLGRSRGSILKSEITQRSRRTKFSRKTPAGAHHHTDALAPRSRNCRQTRVPSSRLPSPGAEPLSRDRIFLFFGWLVSWGLFAFASCTWLHS